MGSIATGTHADRAAVTRDALEQEVHTFRTAGVAPFLASLERPGQCLTGCGDAGRSHG
jgi:predicted transcriptional regulator